MRAHPAAQGESEDHPYAHDQDDAEDDVLDRGEVPERVRNPNSIFRVS